MELPGSEAGPGAIPGPPGGAGLGLPGGAAGGALAVSAARGSDETVGLALAISSSAFIGASFIIKKKGLRVAARGGGASAGAGGYGYLREPLWWTGMSLMVVGEVANFAAYAYAPPILVTPMGALSIVVSAALAHVYLHERLNAFGVLGCMLCIVGSTTLVLHAPPEQEVGSITEMFALAMRPAFLVYAAAAGGAVVWLVWRVAPKVSGALRLRTPPAPAGPCRPAPPVCPSRLGGLTRPPLPRPPPFLPSSRQYGHTHIFVYIGICSIMGSLSVMSCKALGLALRLTFQGHNQLGYPSTHLCIVIVAVCVATQMNYLNKALDLFNTAIVSPIYYVMFTTLTILASVLMLRPPQTLTAYLTQACGFLTIVAGTFLLHTTKDMEMQGSVAGFGAKKGAGPLIRARLAGEGGVGGADTPLSPRRSGREELLPLSTGRPTD